MFLYSQLEEKLKQALLSRDLKTVEVLKLIKSPILLKAKELNQAAPSDEICQNLIHKQIKIYQEAIDLYKNQNQLEVIAQKEQEIKILKDLLPPQLNQLELENLIDEIVAESGLNLELRNFKALIELIEEKVALRANRSQIAQILKKKVENV